MSKRDKIVLRSSIVTRNKAKKTGLSIRRSVRVMVQKERTRAEAEQNGQKAARDREWAEKDEESERVEAENSKKARAAMAAAVKLASTGPATVEMTEYERRRAENIRRNNEILQRLGIETTKEELERGRGRFPTPRPKSRVPRLPVRRSARVRAKEAGSVEEGGPVEQDGESDNSAANISCSEPPVEHAGSASSNILEGIVGLPLESSLRSWARSVGSNEVSEAALPDWRESFQEGLSKSLSVLVTNQDGCGNTPASPRFAICGPEGGTKKEESLPCELLV